MTPRHDLTRLACVAALAAGAAVIVARAGRAATLGPEEAAVWLLIAYGVFSAVGLGLSGAFTTTRKVFLIVACVGVASLLTLAVTGRLGALSLPLIVVGPSLPFLIASRLSSPLASDSDSDPGPSPTLSLLLRGKRLRAAASCGYRKPRNRPDENWF